MVSNKTTHSVIKEERERERERRRGNTSNYIEVRTIVSYLNKQGFIRVRGFLAYSWNLRISSGGFEDEFSETRPASQRQVSEMPVLLLPSYHALDSEDCSQEKHVLARL